MPLATSRVPITERPATANRRPWRPIHAFIRSIATGVHFGATAKLSSGRLEQEQHHQVEADHGQHRGRDRVVQRVDPGQAREVRRPGQSQHRTDQERRARRAPAHRLLPARWLLVLLGLPAAALRDPGRATGADHERDRQCDPAECEIGSRAQRMLRRAGRARPLEREHDDQPERDARHQGSGQVPQHQALGVGQQQHHRRGRDQGRIERSRQCEDEDAAHSALPARRKRVHLTVVYQASRRPGVHPDGAMTRCRRRSAL